MNIPLFIHWDYLYAHSWQFKVTNKRDYYAWLYGNYQAELVFKDSLSAYMMGGEL